MLRHFLLTSERNSGPLRSAGPRSVALRSVAPFAAAVVVAPAGGGDRGWASMLAAAFCATRVVYTARYLANLPTLRSLVWMAAFACTGALFALPLVG
jgi:uncharacterized MAPEG superfamily protein